jgi:hypothetical protein
MWDALLHATAVQSLNRTIHALGVDRVQQAVAEFQKWQVRVEQACGSNNETEYPCSATGTSQLELVAASCYIRDFGCGYPLIE